MTRLEFRGRVESPRPPAAWLMSGVAAATLWLTGQLPLWVIGLQLAAFAYSFATRLEPPRFRSDPICLNLMMMGVTTVTIRSALSGNPATVSLAYFTALAQGLQLVDARPRKSEFVLVALALFQVVLASNLTDSVFFPPLVLVFLVSVTWTLLVHTLALEAVEAGDPQAVERAIAPDLRRLTAGATTACVALALVLFVVLPRLKTSVLQGGLASGLHLSGFSHTVALGDAGPIVEDDTVVLRVEAESGTLPAPRDAYWRGLAFDAFDGRRWSISESERKAARQPVNGVGRFGIELRGTDRGRRVSQRLLREAMETEVVFTPGEPRRIEGPFQRLERDANGGLYVPGHAGERLRYTIWTTSENRNDRALAQERARPPDEPSPGGARPALRYLALPPLDPRVSARAESIVAGARNDLEKALRLERTLRAEGRYTTSPAPLGDGGTSPIEAFLLGELEGHCEYFASAMVVLARSAGLPARLVNGFAGGRKNEVGGFLEVRQADAHAWVEIHFEESGWIRFDPTPPDRRLRSEAAHSLGDRALELASALELWWFEHVVDYDSADQIGFLRGLWLRFAPVGSREGRTPGAPSDETLWDEWRLPGATAPSLPLVALLFVGFGGVVLWLHRRGRRPSGPGVPESYRRAQRLLARHGLRRAPAHSARDFLREVERALPEEGARAFAEITAAYLAERFGARATSDQRAALSVLENAVDRMRLRNQTHVGEA